MNTQRYLTFTCTSLVLAFATFTHANLLVDPGFEANPLTTASNVLNNFTTYQGQWGHENSTITGVDGGVTPPEGVKMLRMMNDGLTATQTFQTTNVTSYAGLIDSGGGTVSLSALFNAGSNVPAAGAQVAVQFFSGANYGLQIGSAVFGSLTLDNNSSSWEVVSLSAPIPVNTRWLLSQVIYNNASIGNQPGYVDAARLDIVPEPASLALVALGGMAVLRRRHHQRA